MLLKTPEDGKDLASILALYPDYCTVEKFIQGDTRSVTHLKEIVTFGFKRLEVITEHLRGSAKKDGKAWKKRNAKIFH